MQCLYTLDYDLGYLLMLSVDAAEGEKYQSAIRCPYESGSLAVQCGKSNERLKIKSVGYGYTPNCSYAMTNECIQTRLVSNICVV